MTRRTSDEALTPASLVPASGDPASMDAWAAELVERARAEGVALTGDGGLLTDLMRHVLQRGLEVEMTEHLGYEGSAAGLVDTSCVGLRPAEGWMPCPRSSRLSSRLMW